MVCSVCSVHVCSVPVCSVVQPDVKKQILSYFSYTLFFIFLHHGLHFFIRPFILHAVFGWKNTINVSSLPFQIVITQSPHFSSPSNYSNVHTLVWHSKEFTYIFIKPQLVVVVKWLWVVPRYTDVTSRVQRAEGALCGCVLGGLKHADQVGCVVSPRRYQRS